MEELKKVSIYLEDFIKSIEEKEELEEKLKKVNEIIVLQKERLNNIIEKNDNEVLKSIKGILR